MAVDIGHGSVFDRIGGRIQTPREKFPTLDVKHRTTSILKQLCERSRLKSSEAMKIGIRVRIAGVVDGTNFNSNSKNLKNSNSKSFVTE